MILNLKFINLIKLFEDRHSEQSVPTTKTGLEDILIEASNHSDGEAEDVEMM